MYTRKVISLRTLCFAATVALLVLYTITIIMSVSSWRRNIEMELKNIPSCYLFPNDLDGVNGDVLNDKTKLEPGRSIFFVITTCSEQNEIALKPRQVCAIESAALHHPNRSIFVLFTSPVRLSSDSESPFVAPLRSYANIHFLNLNLRTIALGTPVKGFFQSGVMFNSSYLIEHMSDIVRILVLYKYGGIYLDTDVVVQKNMDEFPTNFLGKEAYDKAAVSNVNNAVLGFQDEVGHDILELCLMDLITSYQPDAWSYNGGLLLTRVLENHICHTSLVAMTLEQCRGFKVFSKEEFYAINYNDWDQFFNANDTEAVLETIKRSSVVHIWNKLSHSKIITKSKTKTAYEILAEKNCPKAFKTSGEYF